MNESTGITVVVVFLVVILAIGVLRVGKWKNNNIARKS
jgi:hypothetical protein